RVFTLRGIGTVVTGTLWSGSIGEGDELRAEPGARTVRVRSVQVHDRPVDRAEAGQRVAVALPGIERHELRRGDALVTPRAEPVRVESLRHLGELAGVEQADGWAFSRTWLDELRADLERRIAAADPLDPGVAPPSEPWATAVVPLLGFERRGAKLYRPGATAELGARAEAAAALEAALGLEAVKVEDAALARFLEEQGRLVRVGDGYAVSAAAYEQARATLVGTCESEGRIALARFRDLR